MISAEHMSSNTADSVVNENCKSQSSSSISNNSAECIEIDEQAPCGKQPSLASPVQSSKSKNNGFANHVNEEMSVDSCSKTDNGVDDSGESMAVDGELKVATKRESLENDDVKNNGDSVTTNGVHSEKIVNGHDVETSDLKTKVILTKESDGEEADDSDVETQQQLKKLKILDERYENKKLDDEHYRLRREKYLKLKQLELDLKKEEAQLMLFKRLYYSQRLAPTAVNPNTQQRNGIMNKGLPNKQQYLMQNQRGNLNNNLQQQQQQQPQQQPSSIQQNALLNKNRPIPGPGQVPNAQFNRGPSSTLPGMQTNRQNQNQSPQLPNSQKGPLPGQNQGQLPPGARVNNLPTNKVPQGANVPNKINSGTPTNGSNRNLTNSNANSPMNLGNPLASIMTGLPPVPSASLMSPQTAFNPSVSPQPSPVPPFNASSNDFNAKKAPNSQAVINQLVRKEYERSLAQIELPKGPAQDIYFIPSVNQMEFLMCLGLEEVVKCVHEQMSAKQAREREKEKEKNESANGEVKKENGTVELKREAGENSTTNASNGIEIHYKYPLICASCSTDWTTVWRKDKNGVVLCDRCLKITERKHIKSEHNARLKQGFAKAAKDREQIEKQLLAEQQAAVAAAAAIVPPPPPSQSSRERDTHLAQPSAQPPRDLLIQQQRQQQQQQRNNSPQVNASSNQNAQRNNSTPGSGKSNNNNNSNSMYASPHNVNSHSSNNNYLTPNTSSSNHHQSSNSASRHQQGTPSSQPQQQRSNNRMPMDQHGRPHQTTPNNSKNVNSLPNSKSISNNNNTNNSSNSNARMSNQNHMTPPNASANMNKNNKATPNSDMVNQRQRQPNNSNNMNHHSSSSPSMHQGANLKSSSSQSNLANNSQSAMAAFQQQLAAMQGGGSSSNNPLMAFAQQQQQQQQLLRLMASQPTSYNPLLAGFQSNQAAQMALNYLNSFSTPGQQKQWKP